MKELAAQDEAKRGGLLSRVIIQFKCGETLMDTGALEARKTDETHNYILMR
jgi:hypothetical protein